MRRVRERLDLRQLAVRPISALDLPAHVRTLTRFIVCAVLTLSSSQHLDHPPASRRRCRLLRYRCRNTLVQLSHSTRSRNRERTHVLLVLLIDQAVNPHPTRCRHSRRHRSHQDHSPSDHQHGGTETPTDRRRLLSVSGTARGRSLHVAAHPLNTVTQQLCSHVVGLTSLRIFHRDQLSQSKHESQLPLLELLMLGHRRHSSPIWTGPQSRPGEHTP